MVGSATERSLRDETADTKLVTALYQAGDVPSFPLHIDMIYLFFLLSSKVLSYSIVNHEIHRYTPSIESL